MDEPLKYLSRQSLLLTILLNIEYNLLLLPKNNAIRKHWEMSPNWVRVQKYITSNTMKAGSTSSGEQCIFIGLDPDSRELLHGRK